MGKGGGERVSIVFVFAGECAVSRSVDGWLVVFVRTETEEKEDAAAK